MKINKTLLITRVPTATYLCTSGVVRTQGDDYYAHIGS